MSDSNCISGRADPTHFWWRIPLFPFPSLNVLPSFLFFPYPLRREVAAIFSYVLDSADRAPGGVRGKAPIATAFLYILSQGNVSCGSHLGSYLKFLNQKGRQFRPHCVRGLLIQWGLGSRVRMAKVWGQGMSLWG